MAWGFGDDDDGQPQQRSFLGSIGSFLMKWVVLPIVAVLSLGLIFKNDTARNFVDGFTGGDGKGDGNGAATWLNNMIGKSWDKIKDFVGIKPDAPTPETIAIPRKLGNFTVLEAQKGDFTNDAIVKDRKAQVLLANVGQSYADINNPKVTQLTSGERVQKVQELDELRANSFKLGKKVEVLDIAIDKFKAQNNGSQVITPDKSGLESKLPIIPADLVAFAKEKVGESWGKLPRLSQIEILENAVYEEAAKKVDLGKRSLKEEAGIFNGRLSEILLPDRVPSRIIGPISSLVIGTDVGKTLMPDKHVEIIGRKQIEELLDRKDFAGALKLSDGIKSYFQNTTENIAGNIVAYKKNHPEIKIDEELVLYRGAVKDFGDISKKIIASQRKDLYDNSVGNPTHAALRDVAKTLPDSFNAYSERVSILESNIQKGYSVPPPPSGPIQISHDPEVMRKALEADKAKNTNGGKKEEGTNIENGTTAVPPASPAAPTKTASLTPQ